MYRYKTGEIRQQIRIISLEQQIPELAVVRFIDIFVETLNMVELEFKYAETKDTGNKPYDPKDLLKLYIYGYFYGIRSSRKLETETKRNIEVRWLIHELSPDFKTISDFRKDNIDAIKKVFKSFTLLCQEQELIGGSTIGIDGTKVKAVNSPDKVYTKASIKKDKEYVDKKIEKYIKDLEDSEENASEGQEPLKESIKGAIEKLKEKKERLIKIEEEIAKTGEQVAKTDKDCRIMKTRKGFDACYNIQTVVDSKHKLIVTYDVTNDCNDEEQLEPMVNKAQEIIGNKEIEVLVDRGYRNAVQVESVEKNGATVYMPEKDTRPGDFKYDKTTDSYTCMEGKTLKYESTFKQRGRHVKRYKCTDCKGCIKRDQCTNSKTGRTIKVLKNQKIMDEVDKRTKRNPEKMKERSKICEHPFGTIKQNMGFRYFLVKSLRKVQVEAGLVMLAYNIKRVVNILIEQKTIKNVLLLNTK